MKLAMILFFILFTRLGYAAASCEFKDISLCKTPESQSLKKANTEDCYSIYLWFDKKQSENGKGTTYLLNVCEQTKGEKRCQPAYYTSTEPRVEVVNQKNTLERCEKEKCAFVNFKDMDDLEEAVDNVIAVGELQTTRMEIEKIETTGADKENLPELKKKEEAAVKAGLDKQYYYRGTKLMTIKREQEGQLLDFYLKPEVNHEKMAKNFYANGPDTFKNKFALSMDMIDSISGLFDKKGKAEKQKVIDALNRTNEDLYNQVAKLVKDGKQDKIYLFQYGEDENICADAYYRKKPWTLTMHYGLAGLLGGRKALTVESASDALDPKMVQERLLTKKTAKGYKTAKGSNAKQFETKELKNVFEQKTAEQEPAE